MGTHERSTLTARIGSTIADRYRLVRLLGAGGMGAVYAAVHVETERRVAVKLLLGDGARRPDLVARMRREARAATKIGHPNIAQVFDFGVEPDGTAYLVQELLIGEDLDARLARAPQVAPRTALEIITPVMGALVAAHRHGVIHRDVKGANIHLSVASGGGMRVVLLDFGLAKLVDTRASQALTHAGAVLGTVAFMAPEQLRGDGEVGPQADVWAVGVVLHEMLAGRPLFEGPNWAALAHAVLVAPVPRLRDRAPWVPPPLAAVVERALEREGARRFATMGAFLERLLDCEGLRDEQWFDVLRRSHASTPGLKPPTWTVDDFDDEAPTLIAARRATTDVDPPDHSRETTNLAETTSRAIVLPLQHANVRGSVRVRHVAFGGAMLALGAGLAVVATAHAFWQARLGNDRPRWTNASRLMTQPSATNVIPPTIVMEPALARSAPAALPANAPTSAGTASQAATERIGSQLLNTAVSVARRSNLHPGGRAIGTGAPDWRATVSSARHDAVTPSHRSVVPILDPP